jgi:HSP20 family molecular chaperone IbpA
MNDQTLYQQVGLGRLSLVRARGSGLNGAHFYPPTDVIETDDAIVVVVEVAGLREGEYEVSLTDGARVLTVAGRRQAPTIPGERLTYHRLEVQYGTFVAQVELPWALEGVQTASATYDDGFLTVILPKVRRRRVAVQAVSSTEKNDPDEKS